MSNKWKISRDNLNDIARLIFAIMWVAYCAIGVFYNGDMLHKIYFALVALTFFIYYKLWNIDSPNKPKDKDEQETEGDTFHITYGIHGEEVGTKHSLTVFNHTFNKTESILEQVQDILLKSGFVRKTDKIGIECIAKL